MRISAEAGEAIQDFARRMTWLRIWTDEDFTAVHNDRAVQVTEQMRDSEFLRLWDSLAPRTPAEQAVIDLDSIDADSDPEKAHGDAEGILLSLAPDEVKLAYSRLLARARWWASA